MRSNHTYLPALAIVQIQEKNSMIFINAASHYYINDLKKNQPEILNNYIIMYMYRYDQ
jgi:hypothetical protein